MNEYRKISWQGIIGSIINIFFGLGVCIISSYAMLNNINFDHIFVEVEDVIYILLLTLCILLGILSILNNSKLLKGNLTKKKSAIIFGILTLSIIGVGFLIFTKEIVKIKRIKVKIIEEEVNYHDIINALLRYKSLLDQNIISQDEFRTIKSKILNHL